MPAQICQDRVDHEMTFTFTSDRDENWRQVVTLNQHNWFYLQNIDVGLIASYECSSCNLNPRDRQVFLITK